MSKLNPGFKNKNFEEESSDDSITGLENPEEPLFYMFPESSDEEDENKEKLFKKNIKNISRKQILSKLDLLSKYHKKSEDKIAHKKVGWGTIYELFFEKLFFIDKEVKENGIFINLKEVEVRIRRELGKIGKSSKNQSNGNSTFSLFDKLQYNPPVSAWYSSNFINDNLNRLIAPKEKNSYLCKVINEFVNYEDKKEEVINDNMKEEENVNNNNININNRSSKYVNTNSNISHNTFMDNMMKKIDKLNKEEELMENSLFEENIPDKDLIPKGAKKVINKFLKKYDISNIDYVEDEMNNIQTNEKAYEIELRNAKLFESKFLEENKFLIDFNYLKNALQKEKKDDYVENKKELDQLFTQIDKTINLIKKTSNMV
jgi:hypothetical protein